MTKYKNVKINDNISTKRTSLVNIKEIIESNLFNTSILHNIITQIYNLKETTSHRYGTGAVAIKTNDKESFIINFSPEKNPVPSGNLNAQLKALTIDLNGFDRIKAQLSILDKMGANTRILSPSNNPIIKPTITTKNLQPKKRKTKQKLNYEVAPVSSPQFKNVLRYFDEKTGIITPNELNLFGVVPILSKSGISQKGKKYKYTYRDNPNDIGFIYRDGTGDNSSIFLKQPNDKKAKFIWIKKPKYFAYLIDFCLNSNCHTCIICGGQDDAICINLHFNEFGICAVAVGGESRIIESEIINKLKAKFEIVSLCFDYDKESKTGQIWSLKNSEHYDIDCINLSSTSKIFNHEICKDICEMWQKIGLINYSKFLKIGNYLFNFI